MFASPSAIVLGALFLAYPLLVYCGLTFFEPRMAALVLVLLAISRFALAKPSTKNKEFPLQVALAFATALVIGFVTLITNSPAYLRFYPMCINALMFVLFLISLLHPPSIIEQIARISDPCLSEVGTKYTRNVTKVWCCFFALNGALAFCTAIFTSLEVWTLYNGVISYVLIGHLLAGEYIFRVWLRKQKIL